MIRPYEDDDLEDVLDVWYRASLIAHSFLPEEFYAVERGRIADRWLPISETLVYETQERVVGFMSLIDTEVGGLFVDPDYQRRGIGRALLDAAANSRPMLELSVFEANSIGRSFYEGYGFEVIDRRIEVETGQPELRLRFAGGLIDHAGSRR